MPPYQYRGRATYPSYYSGGEPKAAQYYRPPAYNPYAYRGPASTAPTFSPGARPTYGAGYQPTYRPPAPQRYAPAAAMAAQSSLPWYQVLSQRLRMLEAQISNAARPPSAYNPLVSALQGPFYPGASMPNALAPTFKPPARPTPLRPVATPSVAWATPYPPYAANEPKVSQYYQPPPTGPQGYAQPPGPSQPSQPYGGGYGGGYGYGGRGGGGYKSPGYPSQYPQAAETGQPFMQRGGREGQQPRFVNAPELPRWLARLVSWNY